MFQLLLKMADLFLQNGDALYFCANTVGGLHIKSLFTQNSFASVISQKKNHRKSGPKMAIRISNVRSIHLYALKFIIWSIQISGDFLSISTSFHLTDTSVYQLQAEQSLSSNALRYTGEAMASLFLIPLFKISTHTISNTFLPLLCFVFVLNTFHLLTYIHFIISPGCCLSRPLECKPHNGGGFIFLVHCDTLSTWNRARLSVLVEMQ